MKNLCKPLIFVLALAALGCGPAQALAGTENPAETKETYQIVIDKIAQICTVLGMDESGAYTVVVRQMPCSTGKDDSDTPTGSFSVGTKARWLSSKKYGTFEQYASRVVGSIWIHSTVFKTKSPNALVRSSFTNIGRPVSMGCIRLSVGDAKWVYDHCPQGTAIRIVQSGGPEAVCLETLPALPLRGSFDPTDPAVVKNPEVRIAVTETLDSAVPVYPSDNIEARAVR